MGNHVILKMFLFIHCESTNKLRLFSSLFLMQDLQTEVERISRTNIVVCTPGRLLQHMDMTPDFECSNLQMLGK